MDSTDIAVTLQRQLAVLEPEFVQIVDDSARHKGHAGSLSGGGHYRLTIVSPHFAACKIMERHRLVYHALASSMQCKIHALSISAYTPAEFQAQAIGSPSTPLPLQP